MSQDKFVAYVSTYTMGDKLGIKIFDVDMEAGRLIPKDSVQITNSSYITVSKNRKFLYSITDFGVEAFKILKDGNLEKLNEASINGMRGCYLSTDHEDKLLFVAGYHDGKVTILRLNDDGSIGEITDEIFHKGMGSIAERNFRPHVNCARMTMDNKFLVVADIGMDHLKIYKINHRTGTAKLVDVLHCELESAPRHVKFSKDGKFMYVVHELKNYIVAYKYYEEDDIPHFEKIQTISTLNEKHSGISAASALNFSLDYNYVISSNAGDDTVVIYNYNQDTGLLSKILCLPINGSYPKDATLFPDNKHLISLNHESNTLTFFTTDLEKGTIVLNGPEIPCDKPNTVIFHRLL